MQNKTTELWIYTTFNGEETDEQLTIRISSQLKPNQIIVKILERQQPPLIGTVNDIPFKIPGNHLGVKCLISNKKDTQ